jgi:4-hydroxyphenylpyruvate dioxygenase-like putative hemolysin
VSFEWQGERDRTITGGLHYIDHLTTIVFRGRLERRAAFYDARSSLPASATRHRRERDRLLPGHMTSPTE